MLVDRNHVMLLIHGGRGIGKGSLLQIIRQLVGAVNYGEIPSAFFESRFRGVLKYKRVCAFDEIPVERKFINDWKLLPEPHMAIEDKGIELATYENHASYIVTNNTEAEVSILGDERKFSVPKCRDTGELVDHIDQDVWEDFVQGILSASTDDLANIGWWLIKHGKSDKYDNRRPFKSDTFYEIVDKALTNWQRGIIIEIERKEWKEINLADIEDVTRGTGRIKIEKFLNVHRDRDGDLYGYIKQMKGGERVIIPHKKYLPDSEEEEEQQQDTSDDIDLASMEF
jgi:hypothetical protein